ncbi:MFS transporter [Methylobacterium sp. E-045]|uniref:MFS transporter n=1 Tax=Methylobacterium sp. E-045 TaxID=2836575 RepID=UPI001FBAB734|nr:MFS transporter [Methylobacterium sp. E-045]MCJ2129809.1 MFS transporter [Methylobacterium sp. E-045]
MSRERGPVAEAPLAAVLAAVGGLYVAQSVVTGVTLVALPAILRESGLPLERIGLVYLALLPWVLKGLWAGAVERYRLPPAGPPRTPRIVALGTLISALALAASAAIGPASFGPLLACLLVAALATATVDIACDGFAVETLSARHRGWGNAAQVGGAYLGLSIGGALFLLITANAGWTVAALVTAALILGLGLPFLLLAPRLGADARRGHRPGLAAALRNPHIRTGLLLVLVFDLGLRLGQSMLGPFLIDAGLSLKAVGLISGLGGAGVGLLGTLVGGAAVRRLGSAASVRIAIAAQGLALAALALAAAWGLRVPELLGALALLAAATAAFGFVTLYAELMGYASPTQAGIDFTLFQCADALIALIALLGGAVSGVLAGRLGYPACFALAACASLAAALAAARLIRRAAAAGAEECTTGRAPIVGALP